jgi:hypothetical protein
MPARLRFRRSLQRYGTPLEGKRNGYFEKNPLVKQIFLGKGAAIAYDQQEATPTVA